MRSFSLLLATLTSVSALAQEPCHLATSPRIHEVCRLTNAERAKRGLEAMVFDPLVARVAQAHANDMYRRDYFSHTTPEGLTWKDRLDRGHVPYGWSGENIAYGYQTPEDFMQAWMASQGHRENILHVKFSHLGIGWAGDRVVQDFTDGKAQLIELVD